MLCALQIFASIWLVASLAWMIYSISCYRPVTAESVVEAFLAPVLAIAIGLMVLIEMSSSGSESRE